MIESGTRIGPYEILGPVGQGGMGEVYRARDTQLNRTVAMKVLPASFATDPERLARFEREAQTLAALNHSNIAQIYGMVDLPPEGGRHKALVMEFVDGEDLSQVLARGALPAGAALRLAGQIVDALDEAHERGIVHRDLKPANIKVRSDGTLKVLDFGLAKALAPGGASDAPHGDGPFRSPTFTSPAVTELGTILGTAAYMAPEQAKGRAVDRRADIWAFGVILFEMLAGRPMFAYDSVAETIGAVVHRDVDWNALPPATPPHVRTLLRQCLQKDPKQRLRDIGDARPWLDDTLLASGSQFAAHEEGLPLRTWLPWLVAGVCMVIAVVVAWWSLRNGPTGAAPEIRFVVQSPVEGVPAANPVLARDGSFLVYQADRLYVRSLADAESRPLAGTEGALWPFLSPDGKWVGFYAEGAIKKIAIGGGDPITVTAADSDTPGAVWAPDGGIYFSPGWNGSALWRVHADGGAPTQVSTLDGDAGERGHWWAQPLPDGRHLLLTIWYAAAGLTEAKIGVLDLQTGKHRVLFPGARPSYAAGQILYHRAGGYHLVAFDAAALAVTGEPRSVLADALALEPQGSSTAPLSLAANGTLAYMSGVLYPELQMTWILRDGREEITPVTMRVHDGVDLSADGDRIAAGRPQGGTTQIWVADLKTGGEQRLSAAGLNFMPVWHPAGQHLVFISMRRGDFDIYLQRLDGSPEEPVVSTDGDESPEAWLPQGRSLVVKNWLPDGSTSFFLLDLDRETRTPLLTGAFQKGPVRASRDGRWLAFVANPSGTWQVLLRAIDGSGGVSVVPRHDVLLDTDVRWGTDGRLYFIGRSGLVEATVVERDGRPTVARQEVIATVPPGTLLAGVSPDGQRVLVGKPVVRQGYGRAGIHVLVNGLAALARGERP